MLSSNINPSIVHLEQSTNRAHREIDSIFAGILEIVTWSGFQLSPDQQLDCKLALMELRTVLSDKTHSDNGNKDLQKQIAKTYLKEKIQSFVRFMMRASEIDSGKNILIVYFYLNFIII